MIDSALRPPYRPPSQAVAAPPVNENRSDPALRADDLPRWYLGLRLDQSLGVGARRIHRNTGRRPGLRLCTFHT